MPGEIVFGWDTLEIVAADPRFRDLIERQWKELAQVDGYPCPDYKRGFAMEKAGHWKLWTGRQDDRLVGFIQWQILPPLGYRGMLWAFDCGHYIDPEIRDIFVALRMWREAEPALKALGVSMIRGHDNHRHPLGPFFKRLGYESVSTAYQKVIE